MPCGYSLCFWKPNAIERLHELLFFNGEHSCGWWRVSKPEGRLKHSSFCSWWHTREHCLACMSVCCWLLTLDRDPFTRSAGPMPGAVSRLEITSLGHQQDVLTMLPQEQASYFSQSILHFPLGQEDTKSLTGMIYALHIKSYSKNLALC